MLFVPPLAHALRPEDRKETQRERNFRRCDKEFLPSEKLLFHRPYVLRNSTLFLQRHYSQVFQAIKQLKEDTKVSAKLFLCDKYARRLIYLLLLHRLCGLSP